MMTASTLRQMLILCVLGLAACQTPHVAEDAKPEPVTDLHDESRVTIPIAAFTTEFPVPAQAPPPPVPQPTVILPPDLWRDLRDGFALDHHGERKRVQQELAWLQRNPQYLQRLKPRLERHLAYIHQQVRARDFPSEIALLPIVESAMDPYAFSHGGAAGLWQFIPATGKRFGLQRNWWYDGRRDPVAATEAALDYLARLHKRFGDWSLALAGYNAGEGNVNRALRRAAEGASFWELKLPRETAAYVPRLLALAELVSHPEQFGIELPTISPQVPFIIVDTRSQLDLSVAAAATGIDVDTLYLWNPALNQWATPPQGPHHLLIPATHAETAQAKLANIPATERVQWLRIEVANGDTLSQLAQRYRTDVGSLRRANNLSSNTIRAGHSLLIPKTDAALSNPVARRSRGRLYVVKSGDSLWSIARAEKLEMASLMKANHVGPKDTLRIGQQLTLPGGTSAVIRKVRYGVRSGDSLAKIAQKFNVAVGEIANWNRLDVRDYLQPGQSLIVYVDVAAGQ